LEKRKEGIMTNLYLDRLKTRRLKIDWEALMQKSMEDGPLKKTRESFFSWISLSRSQDEDPGQRLENCLMFVCGRVGVHTMDSILRLHDHKGCLEVHSTRSLLRKEKKAFRDAWSEIGYEPNIEFISREHGEEPEPD
jgi:hypothetical protein